MKPFRIYHLLIAVALLAVPLQAAIVPPSSGGSSGSIFTNRLITIVGTTTNRIWFTNANNAFGATNAIHIKSNAVAGAWQWMTNLTDVAATNDLNRPTGTWHSVNGGATYGTTRYDAIGVIVPPVSTPSSSQPNPVFVNVTNTPAATNGMIPEKTGEQARWSFPLWIAWETNSLTRGIIFMDAIGGSDDNSGTASHPVATGSKAMSLATNGSTIVGVRGTWANEYLGKPGVGWYFSDGTVLTNCTFVIGAVSGLWTNDTTNVVIRGQATLIGGSAYGFWLSQTNSLLDVEIKDAQYTTTQALLNYATGGNSNRFRLRASGEISGRINWSETGGLTNVSLTEFIAGKRIRLQSVIGAPNGSDASGYTNRVLKYTAPEYVMESTWATVASFFTAHLDGGIFYRNGIAFNPGTGASNAKIVSRGVRFASTNDLPSTLVGLIGNYTVGDFPGTRSQGYASYLSNLSAPTSVTLTGSPFSWTNTTLGNRTVFIDAGTVSDIKVNGSTVFTSTGKTFTLQPNEYTTVTYSADPTITTKPF